MKGSARTWEPRAEMSGVYALRWGIRHPHVELRKPFAHGALEVPDSELVMVPHVQEHVIALHGCVEFLRREVHTTLLLPIGAERERARHDLLHDLAHISLHYFSSASLRHARHVTDPELGGGT